MSTFSVWTICSLVMSLVLSRELLQSELFGVIVSGTTLGTASGMLHYFLTPRMRSDRRREQQLRDQQRRPR